MLGQRGELLEAIRMKMLADAAHASASIVEAQFQITLLFERILWLGSATLTLLCHPRDAEPRTVSVSTHAALEAQGRAA